MKRKALITGITGQDGSYLAELLISKGYEVHGVVRRSSSISRSRLQTLYSSPDIYGRALFLHYSDLDDTTTIRRLLMRITPDEIYHLAGQSHVGLSFEIPESTCEMTAMGTLRLLEIVRDIPNSPRFYHASSSEIFGQPLESPQTEGTAIAPVSPYGCAKAFATQMVRVYRNAFGLFACNGITYNHESPRRGENFVTQKICRTAARIKQGVERQLVLGDMAAERDWGDARDYVVGMWLSLQHEQPEDFVFATGRLHSVADIVEWAFKAVDLNWKEFVSNDGRFMRAVEPARLVGDASKARKLLAWEATTLLPDLIREMTLDELSRTKIP